MVFELDSTLPPELAPLAWLVGTWTGVGVVGYPSMDSVQFGQEIECTHDGRGFLGWESRTWLLDGEGNQVKAAATERGFWRVLRNGEIELLLAHPTGIVEMYVGRRDEDRPMVQLRTDGVLRSPEAKEYNAATRMYGYVDSQLMWAMDMAATGHPMTSHISATLRKAPAA